MFGPTVNLLFAVALMAGAGLWLWRSPRLTRRDWPLATAFVLALGLVGFFGFRMIDRALYWRDPAHTHQAPEGWMTLGYVGRSWHVPPQELAVALGLAPDEVRGLRLSEIAAAQGVPLAVLIDDLSARLAREAPRRMPPPSPPATMPPSPPPGTRSP